MVAVCTVCGVEFNKPDHRVKRTKTGMHYCSRECYVKQPIITQEKTGRYVSCVNCSQVFYRSQATLDLSKSGDWFCSKTCRGSYISRVSREDTNVTCLSCGKEFHTSPSKISTTLYCSRDCWKSFIKSSGPSYYRKFKGIICDTCGFIPEDLCQLDVHHADGNKKNNEENNLITLCANCHRFVHNRDGTLGPSGNKKKGDKNEE